MTLPQVFSFWRVAGMLALFIGLVAGIPTATWSAETDQESPVGAVGGAVHADPFTGTATTSIPIDVPPGRGGIQPDLALVYGSSNGNGWVGPGWKLEKGVIERQTKFGVNYSGDDYVFRLSGINVELVNIGNNEYRAKIEGGFTRIKKLTATDGRSYFEATDKSGTTFIFGTVAGTRVANPSNANNIFRWCLERVEDVHGNYMTLSYTKDQNQAYLKQIDYTGNGSLAPTNQVKFHLETRSDLTAMYTAGFKMTNGKRLKTIELKANGSRMAAYKVSYEPTSSSTILSSIQRYGKNVTINGTGTITGGTTLPAFTVTYPTGGTASFASSTSGAVVWYPQYINMPGGVGDVNGDGKADLVGPSQVYLSTGSGFSPGQSWGGGIPAAQDGVGALADVNGDGKADLIFQSADWPFFEVRLSTGSSFAPATNGAVVWYPQYINMPGGVGDVNGDGKADLVGPSQVYLSTGSGFSPGQSWGGGIPAAQDGVGALADVNGDGKADLVFQSADWPFFEVRLSTGSSFAPATNGAVVWYPQYINMPGGVGDVNGDGKADLVGPSQVYLSTGSGFSPGQSWGGGIPAAQDGVGALADVNGDGKADLIFQSADWPFFEVRLSSQSVANTVTFNNGLGASATVNYTTLNATAQVPIPLQVVQSIVSVDGNNHTSTTSYTYSGGFYYGPERDFRGFNYSKTTGQAGANGEQIITEIWFHQGNDIAVDVNNPNVPNGYMKGAPYRTKVTDGVGNLYSESTTTNTADDNGQAPFFSPPKSVVSTICNGNSCGKQTRTDLTYDSYGNVTREDQYGDTGDGGVDDRTVTRTFSPNTTDWILGLPTSETIHAGLGTGSQVTRTDFSYDGAGGCSTPSGGPTPTKGNLTRVVTWLNGGTSPESGITYDAYGNVTCTRDARGNMTTLAYDASQTFATTSTNVLGQQATTTYYGVNGVATTTGLYGQVKSVTGPNGSTTTSEYDVFGRTTQVTQPNNLVTTTSYNSFGTVGSQHVRTDSSVGLSSWTYFDGLGRTTKTQSTGTDSQIVSTLVEYDHRGAVTRTSLPYFNGGSPQWTTSVYDPLGRVTQSTNPDGSRGLACFDDWVTVSIDANNHRHRSVRDAYGRVLTVQEYTGTYTTCDTSVGSPYSITSYHYDVLGNLKTLTDAKGNVSTMQYDTLSRKTAMHDPDMGDWTYAYDAASNLIQQTDAKSQTIVFQYDALNRRVQKDYGTQQALGQGNVNYVYDGTTFFRKGRLQKVLDGSGITTFYYDNMGQVTRTDKAVSGTTYTTQTTYDTLGRVVNLTYPDLSVVSHTYNGPQLQAVTEGETTYANYGGFNAQGQPSTLTLGNGVVTSYTYDPNNYRLKTLKTEKDSLTLQDLTYTFDAGGNVKTLTDPIQGNQTFDYDDLERLTSAAGPYGNLNYTYDQIGNMTSNSRNGGTYTYPTSGGSSVRPHAVTNAGGNSYAYDPNGNMETGAGRTISYDYENRPDSISKNGTTTTMVYDGDGGRVKKTVGGQTTTYIGKLYVCKQGACARMIFAGGQRVAMKQANGTVDYFHPDHLGSTSVLTNATGNSEQELAYFPYGETFANTGGSSSTVDEWKLEVGTFAGGNDLHESSGPGQPTSATVPNLPTDGSPVYVTLSYKIGTVWEHDDYVYTTSSGAYGTPLLTAPLTGTPLAGATETFTWAANGSAPTLWWLDVGTTLGGADLYQSGNLAATTLSTVVSGLPTDGSLVYARLWYQLPSGWTSIDTSFTAAGGGSSTVPVTIQKAGSGSGTITSLPVGITCGSTCTANFTSGGSITFSATPDANTSFDGWSGAGCTGTSPCVMTPTQAETVTATFTASGPTLTAPLTGTPLAGATETFTWAANGSAPTLWWLDVGTTLGGADLYQSGNLAATTLSTIVSGLPTDGSLVYARLWYQLPSGWTSIDTSFTAAGGGSSTVPVTIQKAGSGSGTITSLPVGITCGSTCTANFTSGGSITFSATPDANTSFDGWSGAGCTGTSPCVMTPTQAETVTATFTASGPTLTAPLTGTPLAGATETFTWAANGSAPTLWWLDVGTTLGGADLYQSGNLAATTLSTIVSGLPTDGSLVYARLWYQLPSGWTSIDTSFTAAGGGSASLSPGDFTMHLAARSTSEQTGPSSVHQLNWRQTTSTAPMRVGGGPLSLRFGLLQDFEAPTNPLVHLVSHGSASSTTISPVGGSVLSGSTVTFSWSYTSGSSSATNVPYKYTGKERDDSTDLYFYEARYYDAALGRFISADTIVPDPTDPQALNRYTYVLNNPLRYIDPTGNGSFDFAVLDILNSFFFNNSLPELVTPDAIAPLGQPITTLPPIIVTATPIFSPPPVFGSTFINSSINGAIGATGITQAASGLFGLQNSEVSPAEASAQSKVQQLRAEQRGGLDDPLIGPDLIVGLGSLFSKGLGILGIKLGGKLGDDLTVGASGRISSTFEDITTKSSLVRNIRINVSKIEFEANLLSAGFSKRLIFTDKGLVNVFSKGNTKITTRDFSRSDRGPTAELFENNVPLTKIGLGN